MTAPERPLKLGEILAETIRIYGERIGAALSLGVVLGGAFLLANWTIPLVAVLIVSFAITLVYAAASRVVAGDRVSEAWAQVFLRLPILIALTLVVSLPVAIGLSQILLIFVAAAWLALTGFAIPVAMLEAGPATERPFERIGHAMRRSTILARAEFLHALGVVAALILLYFLIGILLAQALVAFAENGETAAIALVQVVLAPFFFIGLAVLYFEQRARALEKPS